MARKKYSDEVRAQCVAALLKGQGFPTVSEEFGVPQSTLQYWKKKANNPTTVPALEQRETRIAKLIGDYLEANLKTLTLQAEAFSDADWLREQSASEAGVLHGIMLDKSVRILDAIERAHQHREDESDNVVPITRTANGSSS